MARQKVRQETINKISEMGMARALKHAHENDDPEFREAVRRYYPNARYGPKTRAAAEAATPKSAPAKTEDSPGWDWKTQGNRRRGLGPPVMGARPVQSATPPGARKAVNRRVDPATGGTKTDDKRFLWSKGNVAAIKKVVRPPGIKMWPWEGGNKNRNTPEKRAARIASRKARQNKNRAAAERELGIGPPKAPGPPKEPRNSARRKAERVKDRKERQTRNREAAKKSLGL